MTITRLRGKAKIAALVSTARINVYEGSVRSGKTIGSLIEWAEFCRTGPPGLFLMVGRTERTVINNLILPLQQMLGRRRVKINRGTGDVTINGRKVLIIGANTEDARTKIQGLTLAAAYVDEAATLPESFFNMLVSRLSVAGARMWCTCNPEGSRHWFKVKWLDRAKLWVTGDGRIVRRRPEDYTDLEDDDLDKPINLHRVSFTLDDNAHNLDPEYIADTKANYSGLWYRRMILGEWAIADGAIYDMFDESRHVVDELPPGLEVLGVGVDYGTSNATAGIRLALDPREGVLYVTSEWAPTRGASDVSLSRQYRDWEKTNPNPEYVFLDPAAASLKRQLWDDGVRYADAINDVDPGLKLIASLLDAGLLRIHRSCKHLLDELPAYVWDKKAADKGIDKPLKVNDHYSDAFRYVVISTRRLWERDVALTAA